jgi:DNA-directed RNA polymerase specialized sigma24 family protein
VGFLRQRGVPLGVAQDVALESAFITWRSIAKGTLAVPVDAAGYDQKFLAYMRTVAWRIMRNHKRSGDIFLRYDLLPGAEGTEALISRTYDIEPALELASEIAVEPPKARRILLAMFATGNGPCDAAAAAGMTRDSGKWAMRRCRERAAKRIAAV